MPTWTSRRNILAGVVAGVAGTAAMYAFQRSVDLAAGRGDIPAVKELSLRGGRQDIASLKRRAAATSSRQADATALTVLRIGRAAGIKVTPEMEHLGGMLAHYVFGAVTGAMYGIALEWPASDRSTAVPMPMRGLAFGVGVWALAAEVMLPLLRLAERPARYPARDHLNALASHVVFGATTDATYCLLRSAAS